MKTLIKALLILLIGLTFSMTAFAACSSCIRQTATGPCVAQRCTACVDETISPCACTEPSCGKNPCLSRRDCCRAFGNVGKYTEVDP